MLKDKYPHLFQAGIKLGAKHDYQPDDAVTVIENVCHLYDDETIYHINQEIESMIPDDVEALINLLNESSYDTDAFFELLDQQF